MTPADICARCLANQRLIEGGGAPFPTPAAAVRHLGAVQSQDYAGAKWALSMRTGNPGCGDAELDRLFDTGKILRTHVLRPTWHFVAPEDIRWMLALTAPRVRQAMAFMNRKVGLDAAAFKRGRNVLEKSLRDRQYKTRNELAGDFKRGGVDPGDGVRLAHLMMDAELEGLVTSGPRHGKQFTYALLDERAAKAGTLNHDEALAVLTLRYFTGHGPAQAADFAWWSGLALTEVKRGIESVKAKLASATVDGKTWWWSEEERSMASKIAKSTKKDKGTQSPVIHLLPNYDEYFIAYKDRSSIGERIKASKIKPAKDAFNLHILFVDGLVAGGWKRDVGKAATVKVTPVGKLTAAEKQALEEEVLRFGKFLNLEPTLV